MSVLLIFAVVFFGVIVFWTGAPLMRYVSKAFGVSAPGGKH